MSLHALPSRGVRLAAACLVVSLAGCGLFEEEVKYDYDVLNYDGPAFTEADIWPGWTAEVEGTTVVLRSRPVGADSKITTVIRMQHRPGELPVVTQVWRGPEGGVGSRFREATVQIQHWDPNGVMSGVVEMPVQNSAYHERFWVDRTAE